jgi:transposase-like protein
MGMETPNTPSDLCRLTEEEARQYLERVRWPNVPACPHCGSINVNRLQGKATRPGVFKCRDCRKQFTVTVGTIFERSHIALRHWVYAFASMCASKKGISAHQLHRELGITYKSAWFMCHRIRYAMQREPLCSLLKGTVEADETYVGGRKRVGNYGSRTENDPLPKGRKSKMPVFAVVERGGHVRTRVLPEVTSANLRQALTEMVDPSSHLMTDDYKPYRRTGRMFARHQFVNHSIQEYVKPGTNPPVHTQTIDGFFSILKRGINGTFPHVSREHLHRYCSELEHRYNSRDIDDVQRTARAIKQADGKRLQYRDPVNGLDRAEAI